MDDQAVAMARPVARPDAVTAVARMLIVVHESRTTDAASAPTIPTISLGSSSRSSPPGPDGTGLGLAIVHKVVRAHGGDIKVRSMIGGGSTFTITRPPRRRRARHADGAGPGALDG
jgi:light-regulated signal transduction histidine kinase (bacteriophytochrome)